MAYESTESRDGFRQRSCSGTVRVIQLFEPTTPSLSVSGLNYALRNPASAGFSVSLKWRVLAVIGSSRGKRLYFLLYFRVRPRLCENKKWLLKVGYWNDYRSSIVIVFHMQQAYT
jgi:hypothetical protein